MKNGTLFDQRDVIIIPFPYSDLTSAKLRPAVIISNSKINLAEDRICCLITSKPAKNGLLIENKGLEKGNMPFKSWIKPHRIFTVNERIIKKKVCKISGRLYNKLLIDINKFLKLQD